MSSLLGHPELLQLRFGGAAKITKALTLLHGNIVKMIVVIHCQKLKKLDKKKELPKHAKRCQKNSLKYQKLSIKCPTEILEEIFQYLDSEDLKSGRQDTV